MAVDGIKQPVSINRQSNVPYDITRMLLLEDLRNLAQAGKTEENVKGLIIWANNYANKNGRGDAGSLLRSVFDKIIDVHSESVGREIQARVYEAIKNRVSQSPDGYHISADEFKAFSKGISLAANGKALKAGNGKPILSPVIPEHIIPGKTGRTEQEITEEAQATILSYVHESGEKNRDIQSRITSIKICLGLFKEEYQKEYTEHGINLERLDRHFNKIVAQWDKLKASVRSNNSSLNARKLWIRRVELLERQLLGIKAKLALPEASPVKKLEDYQKLNAILEKELTNVTALFGELRQDLNGDLAIRDADLKLAISDAVTAMRTREANPQTNESPIIIYDSVSEHFVPPANDKLQVVLRLADGLHVKADARMDSIITNMISNARQVEGKGRVIYIDAFSSGRGVVIKISDNGTGVPTKILSTLGRLGVSGKGSTGTGLNFLARRISRYGGQLFYRSNAQGGAEWIIILPPAAAVTGQVSRNGIRLSDTDLGVEITPNGPKPIAETQLPPHGQFDPTKVTGKTLVIVADNGGDLDLFDDPDINTSFIKQVKDKVGSGEPVIVRLDHHGEGAKKAKGKVGAELVLQNKERLMEIIKTCKAEGYKVVVASHGSPYDPDAAISQFLLKQILIEVYAGRNTAGKIDPIYESLARYANVTDIYQFPFSDHPENSLRGILDGLFAKYKDQPELLAKNTDEILHWVVANKVNPNDIRGAQTIPLVEECINTRKAASVAVERALSEGRIKTINAQFTTKDGQPITLQGVVVDDSSLNSKAVDDYFYAKDNRVFLCQKIRGQWWVSLRPGSYVDKNGIKRTESYEIDFQKQVVDRLRRFSPTRWPLTVTRVDDAALTAEIITDAFSKGASVAAGKPIGPVKSEEKTLREREAGLSPEKVAAAGADHVEGDNTNAPKTEANQPAPAPQAQQTALTEKPAGQPTAGQKPPAASGSAEAVPKTSVKPTEFKGVVVNYGAGAIAGAALSTMPGYGVAVAGDVVKGRGFHPIRNLKKIDPKNAAIGGTSGVAFPVFEKIGAKLAPQLLVGATDATGETIVKEVLTIGGKRIITTGAAVLTKGGAGGLGVAGGFMDLGLTTYEERRNIRSLNPQIRSRAYYNIITKACSGATSMVVFGGVNTLNVVAPGGAFVLSLGASVATKSALDYGFSKLGDYIWPTPQNPNPLQVGVH